MKILQNSEIPGSTGPVNEVPGLTLITRNGLYTDYSGRVYDRVAVNLWLKRISVR